MPFVNLKLVKGQATSEQKKLIIEGITPDNWGVDGMSMSERNKG